MANRTLCLRVAEVVGGTKQAFYADLRASLDLSRRAANRATSYCYAVDTELMTGGKCPKLYTYPQVSKEFPGVTTVAATICRAAESKYRQERWQVSRGLKSLPSYRSVPWPLLHNKGHILFDLTHKDGVITATMRLLGQKWTVRLSTGSSHRDQVRGVISAIDRDAIGDSKVWIDRRGVAVIGICVDVPQGVIPVTSGVLRVSTHRDHLLVATKERDTVPFVVNADEVRAWSAEKSRRYQRLRQDRKSNSAAQRRAAEELRRLSDKHSRRMQTSVHRVASVIVDYAVRRRVSEVVFDGTIKSYVGQYPWHDLATKIKYKCETAGIEFKDASLTMTAPDIDKPHVYFRYSPMTGRIKIGKTTNGKSRAKSAATDSPDDTLVVLAVDNQPVAKLGQREKHWHAYHATHRLHGEWFAAEPVITWLREVGWLGNAGNSSQIAQVLDVASVTSRAGHLQADGVCSNGHVYRGVLAECGVNVEDIATCATALEARNQTDER